MYGVLFGRSMSARLAQVTHGLARGRALCQLPGDSVRTNMIMCDAYSCCLPTVERKLVAITVDHRSSRSDRIYVGGTAVDKQTPALPGLSVI